MILATTKRRDAQVIQLLRSNLTRKEVAHLLGKSYANVVDAIRRVQRDRRRVHVAFQNFPKLSK